MTTITLRELTDEQKQQITDHIIGLKSTWRDEANQTPYIQLGIFLIEHGYLPAEARILLIELWQAARSEQSDNEAVTATVFKEKLRELNAELNGDLKPQPTELDILRGQVQALAAKVDALTKPIVPPADTP